jgi:hypothetical protein
MEQEREESRNENQEVKPRGYQILAFAGDSWWAARVSIPAPWD